LQRHIYVPQMKSPCYPVFINRFNVHLSSIIITNQFSCSSIIIIKQHLAVRSNKFFKSPVSSNQDISDHTRYENHSTSLEMVVIRVTIPKWPYFSLEYLQIIQIHHLLVISCYCSTRTFDATNHPMVTPQRTRVSFLGESEHTPRGFIVDPLPSCQDGCGKSITMWKTSLGQNMWKIHLLWFRLDSYQVPKGKTIGFPTATSMVFHMFWSVEQGNHPQLSSSLHLGETPGTWDAAWLAHRIYVQSFNV